MIRNYSNYLKKKIMTKSDDLEKKINALIEKKKIEREALKKILAAFDGNKTKKVPKEKKR